MSIINWLPARRHLHAEDGSHHFCDRRAARQRRLRRRAWEWACRCGRALKLLRRSSLSERLFVFARERRHLFCTVIDSERYRVCMDDFRALHSPKYSRDQTLFWPQVLSHGGTHIRSSRRVVLSRRDSLKGPTQKQDFLQRGLGHHMAQAQG